jgi:hypothetical protein
MNDRSRVEPARRAKTGRGELRQKFCYPGGG